MSRWVRRKRSQNPTRVALPTSRNSIKKNAIEDIKLRLVMVNQLQIMVATVERRDDVAVRRVTQYVLLTVFFPNDVRRIPPLRNSIQPLTS